MDSLKGVQEGRSICLVEHVLANLDAVLGCHSEDKGVKRSVVDRAHRDPVRDDWLAAFRVFLDVGGVEELGVSKSTDRALAFICQEHSPTEIRLMEPASDDT